MLTTILFYLNYTNVLLYGIVITCMFVGIEFSKKNICSVSIFFVIICNLQVLLYLIFGFNIVEKFYPLITHIPLAVFLIFYFEKSFTTSVAAMLSAYLFTSPRRLIGTFFVNFFDGNDNIFYISQMIFSIPIICLIYICFVPSVKSIIHAKGKTPYLFSAFLLIYYIFSYVTTVYSDLLYSGNIFAIETLFTICIICYFFFTTLYYQESNKRIITEHNNKLLRIKTQQAEISLNSMKESQKLTAKYRHDMRHHMHYIKTCLANNEVEAAKAYIDDLYKSFNAVKVKTYCDNMDANLVISYYVSLAIAANITVKIDTDIPKSIVLSPIELCTILSNLLENSIKACAGLNEKSEKKIVVFSSIKDGKFYLMVSNNCNVNIKIVDGLPLSNEKGHGIGVHSIADIVKKYGGVYNFSVKDNIFTFKMLI